LWGIVFDARNVLCCMYIVDATQQPLVPSDTSV
jgi:hypothetical protein